MLGQLARKRTAAPGRRSEPPWMSPTSKGGGEGGLWVATSSKREEGMISPVVAGPKGGEGRANSVVSA